MFKPALTGTLALVCLVASAFADDAPSACRPIEAMKASAAQRGATWIELTDVQRAFVAGISVADPHTPDTMPFGDRAAMMMLPSGGALIVFVDGDKGCMPFPALPPLVAMIVQIGEGTIKHEGDGL